MVFQEWMRGALGFLMKSFFIQLCVVLALLFPLGAEEEEDPSRRDPTSLGPNRIPGYDPNRTPSPEEFPKKPITIQRVPESDKDLRPKIPLLKESRGFVLDKKFVEIRGGGSVWIGGPLVTAFNRNIRAYGFDTDFTYNYGTDIQKAYLYNQAQSYSGAKVTGVRMGFLYEKALSDHWSLGGGIDYREYKFGNVPNNILTKTFIVGNQRFLQGLTPEQIERNIQLEILGSGIRSGNFTGARILFLEVNGSYHFLPGTAWDPYFRSGFGLGNDSWNKSYAAKLGVAGGIRYYFENGIYLGGELSFDAVYFAQRRVVESQARDRIHEIGVNAFLGKEFD